MSIRRWAFGPMPGSCVSQCPGRKPDSPGARSPRSPATRAGSLCGLSPGLVPATSQRPRLQIRLGGGLRHRCWGHAHAQTSLAPPQPMLSLISRSPRRSCGPLTPVLVAAPQGAPKGRVPHPRAISSYQSQLSLSPGERVPPGAVPGALGVGWGSGRAHSTPTPNPRSQPHGSGPSPQKWRGWGGRPRTPNTLPPLSAEGKKVQSPLSSTGKTTLAAAHNGPI